MFFVFCFKFLFPPLFFFCFTAVVWFFFPPSFIFFPSPIFLFSHLMFFLLLLFSCLILSFPLHLDFFFPLFLQYFFPIFHYCFSVVFPPSLITFFLSQYSSFLFFLSFCSTFFYLSFPNVSFNQLSLLFFVILSSAYFSFPLFIALSILSRLSLGRHTDKWRARRWKTESGRFCYANIQMRGGLFRESTFEILNFSWARTLAS